MKKLQKLVLHSATQMTNTQMKNITGGYTSGGYSGGYGYDSGSGSCCYRGTDGVAVCGLSKEAAESTIRTGIGTNWCCDGCGSASWM